MADWKAKKLSEISKLVPSYRYRGGVKTSADGPLALVQPKDLLALEAIKWSELTRMPQGFGSGPAGVKDGDVLLARQGVRFPGSVVREDHADVAVSPLVFHLRPDRTQVDSNYLSWFLNFGLGADYLASNADGALAASIRTETLLNCLVPLPSLEKQKMLGEMVNEIAHQNRIYQKLLQVNQELLRALSETLPHERGGE